MAKRASGAVTIASIWIRKMTYDRLDIHELHRRVRRRDLGERVALGIHQQQKRLAGLGVVARANFEADPCEVRVRGLDILLETRRLIHCARDGRVQPLRLGAPHDAPREQHLQERRADRHRGVVLGR